MDYIGTLDTYFFKFPLLTGSPWFQFRRSSQGISNPACPGVVTNILTCLQFDCSPTWVQITHLLTLYVYFVQPL